MPRQDYLEIPFMKKYYFLLSILLFTGFNLLKAQSKKDMDRAAIKKMCGCYEVGFNYAETFNYTQDATYKGSKNEHDRGLEWVQLVADESNKLVLQHLLIAENQPTPFIVKHWRHDWLFEHTDFYLYDQQNTWRFNQVDKAQVSGQWTQKVYQVDDSPRYEGAATWVHVDGKSYWENQADAPLPLRETSHREDYNVLARSNRHEITDYGWVHDQNNKKLLRKKGKTDKIIAEEKGYNTYTKVADKRCQLAQEWWKENAPLWARVRKNWEELYAQQKDIKLKEKVKGKAIFGYLFSLEPSASKEEIQVILKQFIK